MKRLTYKGSFWPLALMEEMPDAITIYGNVHREPGEIIPATEVIITVPDDADKSVIEDIIKAHDAVVAMDSERTKRTLAASNSISAKEKLRQFYKDTIGLTDDETDTVLK